MMNFNNNNFDDEHDFDYDLDEQLHHEQYGTSSNSDDDEKQHHHNHYNSQFNNKQQQQYGGNNNNNNKNLDYPPYSRLFVLYPKTATEIELKNEFEKYGPIEDLWIVKDKETSLAKGIAYIKYTKASHAAKSIEDLNGKLLNNKHAKPLKVIISNSKNDKKQFTSSTSPPTTTTTTTSTIVNNVIDNDRMLRLFVVIPKDFRKKDLRDAFKKFGEIENVQIIFNRTTNENKGFGYVRFYKASDAARALEECHPKFKPKFAEPYSIKLAREREKNTSVKYLMQNSTSTNSLCTLSGSNSNGQHSQQQQQQQQQSLQQQTSTTSMSSNSSSCSTNSNNSNLLTQQQQQFVTPTTQQTRLLSSASLSSLSSSSASSSNTNTNTNINRNQTISNLDDSCLLIKCSSRLAILHLQSLFNLIPGLVDFKLLNLSNENIDAYYLAKYENGLIASYAYDKLNKFQYPTGEILNIITINLNNLNMQLNLINKLSALQINTPTTTTTTTLQQQQQQLNSSTPKYPSIFSSLNTLLN